METLDDPALLHSGTKALTLGPGQVGIIVSTRGLQYLQFYAGETTGAGKFEIRGVMNSGHSGSSNKHANTVIGNEGAGGSTTGLPTNISPGASPTLYSFVGDSGSFMDQTDFNLLVVCTK